MNRQMASRQRKVNSQPPEPPKGPGQSIKSAPTFSNLQQQQQFLQQQQILQQQRMQQRQQMRDQGAQPQNYTQQKQQQQQQPMINEFSKQRLPPGIPPQVTVPQAIAIIASRLNKIEDKIIGLRSDGESVNMNDQFDTPNELDHAIAQLFERVQDLETVSSKNNSQLSDFITKMNKLENELRDSKDMIIKLQSFSIDTTNKLLAFNNNMNNGLNGSLNSSVNSSTISITSLDEPMSVVIKEIIQNELDDNNKNVNNESY